MSNHCETHAVDEARGFSKNRMHIGTRQGIGVAMLIAGLIIGLFELNGSGINVRNLPQIFTLVLVVCGLGMSVFYTPCCSIYQQLCGRDPLCGFLSSTVLARVLGALILVVFGSWSVHGVLVRHTAFSQELSMQRDLQLEHYQRKLEALGEFADSGAALVYHLYTYRAASLLLFTADRAAAAAMKNRGLTRESALAEYFEHQQAYVSVGSMDGLCLKIAGLYELENATAGALGKKSGQACFRELLDGFHSEDGERKLIRAHINSIKIDGTPEVLQSVEDRFRDYVTAHASDGCKKLGCFRDGEFPSESQVVVLKLRTLQVWADVMMRAGSYESDGALDAAEHRHDAFFDVIEALFLDTLSSMSRALQEEQDSILRDE